MQLDAPLRGSAIRARLGAAVCMLLAAAAPAACRADDATPGTQLDFSNLFYGENRRTSVIEPMVRATRLFSNGQSVSAELGLDVMTGASPSGAVATTQVQTTTSASGTVTKIPAGVLPTHTFRDTRGSLDADWTLPVGVLFKATSSIHMSKEKDYSSAGASATFSIDLFQRLVTLTAGAGFNRDRVSPVGGTVAGLTDGSTMMSLGSNLKRVGSGMLGMSRVVTRRWLMGVSATREIERGYLTEPYKVLTVFSTTNTTPTTPLPTLREKRPDHRTRTSASASSVYHLTDDILYTSYRYYWDDWGVRSHTLDLKLRHELPNQSYVQPHARLYTQREADFFRFELLAGDPLPAFASSDLRLGALRTATLGATYGFRIPGSPGEWSVRAEYLRQWGDGHPSYAPKVQRHINLFPPVDSGTLLVTYSIGF